MFCSLGKWDLGMLFTEGRGLLSVGAVAAIVNGNSKFSSRFTGL
jgi:hypothetical protein